MSTANPSSLPALLATLAAEANNSAVTTLGPNYPNGWATLAYISVPGNPGFNPPVQGFLAQGYSDPSDPTSELIIVLALGIDWASFFSNSPFSVPAVSLSAQISRSSDTSMILPYFYNQGYLVARNAIWNSLSFLGNSQLYICGLGLGAPLAQLAALDLRPSLTPQGPTGQYPPRVQPICYTFSAPNVANNSLVNFYNQQVINQDGSAATQTYWAAKPGLTVDFFPTAPNDATAGPLGQVVNISTVKLPATDVPWLERSGMFYIGQLGGSPYLKPNIPGSITNAPEGYQQVTAYTFAQLTANAYAQAQHGTSSGGVPNYTLQTTVNYGSQPFAFIYTSASTVVAVIRGSITWQEEFQICSNSRQTFSNVIPGAMIHGGISALYDDGSTSTFRAALNAAIGTAIAGTSKKLYLTGHHLGGAIANLAAADYAINKQGGLVVAGVYTFGAMPLGNISFANAYNTALGSNSYQITRVYDKVGPALLRGFPPAYSPLNNSVVLAGLTPQDEETYHSMYGYLQLLNPSAA